MPWQKRISLAAGNLLFKFAIAAVVVGLGMLMLLWA